LRRHSGNGWHLGRHHPFLSRPSLIYTVFWGLSWEMTLLQLVSSLLYPLQIFPQHLLQ